VVAASFLQVPASPLITRHIVDAGPDAADDWIAETCEAGDIVVTHDIPLAERVLRKGAEAIAPNGRVFTVDTIGSALAGRAIGEHLRSMGEVTRGPPPFGAADRSRFLQALDAAVHRVRRRPPTPPPGPLRPPGA
jgi:uncharacterized protein YaiI (UPF0178 family)